MRVVVGACLFLALLWPSAAIAQTPVESARAMLARYHEDPALIDRARDLLETTLARERRPETMIELSHVYFLVGDVRAKSAEEKLAAYDRGREIGKRAVELAPKSEEAHLWYAINTGRWGQTKGVLRSLFLLPTVREELEIIFGLNPNSVRGHALAGNVDFEVPGIAGGDRARAEEHFKKGLAGDPRFTAIRIDLARLYIGSGRYALARQELQRVVDERAPTNLADWTVKDLPRAKQLLETIKDKKK